MTYPTQAEARKASWFSRRHQTRADHDNTRVAYRLTHGKASRRQRALQQRNDELTRYGEGDYLDNRGRSLVKSNNNDRRAELKRKKKSRAAVDIENLERKLK